MQRENLLSCEDFLEGLTAEISLWSRIAEGHASAWAV